MSRGGPGYGIFILVPSDFSKAALVDVVPVVNAHEVLFDAHGATATSIDTTFRLLDAAPLKAALNNSPGVVALIASKRIFGEVARHSEAVDPAIYRPVEVQVKEVSTTAWIALPDHLFAAQASLLLETRDAPPRSPTPGGDPLPANSAGRAAPCGAGGVPAVREPVPGRSAAGGTRAPSPSRSRTPDTGLWRTSGGDGG
ncbi:hypothetical protein [Saccharothrix syringae]|uniref:hypothetical protein n=1 Tax=Saccharothrix syringae TaxID=103733 RepID=UPI001476EF52|nr:hypothetical protein [Saccharothrix syringae]